jgi:hypothetical protein
MCCGSHRLGVPRNLSHEEKHAMRSGIVVLSVAVVIGALWPAGGWGQGPDRLQQIDAQLAEKRAALEAHGKQLEGIKDQTKLNAELRRHFQMTEEILVLMVERRRLADSAPGADAPGGHAGGSQGPGGMRHGPGHGAQGEHGGGMMQREMGGMQGAAPGGPARGMAGMGGSASAPSPGGAAPAPPTGDMEQMMQRVAQHSAYMDTIKNPATLNQEMVRHQKMIDQMMLLMQR